MVASRAGARGDWNLPTRRSVATRREIQHSFFASVCVKLKGLGPRAGGSFVVGGITVSFIFSFLLPPSTRNEYLNDLEVNYHRFYSHAAIKARAANLGVNIVVIQRNTKNEAFECMSTSTDDALQTRYIGYIPRRHRHADIPMSLEHYVRMTETVPHTHTHLSAASSAASSVCCEKS